MGVVSKRVLSKLVKVQVTSAKLLPQASNKSPDLPQWISANLSCRCPLCVLCHAVLFCLRNLVGKRVSLCPGMLTITGFCRGVYICPTCSVGKIVLHDPKLSPGAPRNAPRTPPFPISGEPALVIRTDMC